MNGTPIADQRLVLPDFVIVGAQKSGTTWLARNLRQHPDVYLPSREVMYFDRPQHFSRGPSWYAAHFTAGSAASVLGEKSADYLWVTEQPIGDHLADIPTRLHDLLPDARLIAILREPVARAVSSARHYLRQGQIPPHLHIDEILFGRRRAIGERLGIIDRGRYMSSLDAYLQRYDRSRLLLLIYEEDVVGAPRHTLRRVCEFLGVDPSFPFEGAERPVAVTRSCRLASYLRYYMPARLRGRLPGLLETHLPGPLPEPSADTVARLRALYAPENERLYEFLGRVPGGWPGGDGDG